MAMNEEERIPLDAPCLIGNEKKYLNHCIDTNWVSWQGEFTGKTEKALAAYCNTKHCLTVVNGTAALVLALQVLGIGPNDEVIVPTLTMSATAFAVTTVGATIVWADSTQNGLTISLEDVAQKISNRTKAVMAVHLYGRAVDMKSLLKITEPRGCCVIEDVAEGLGAITSGKKVGSWGTIGCHSFHNKIVASGEGGAITTNDDTLAKKIEELRTPPPDNLGSTKVVLNNRMSNISCAVALAQLERIEKLIAKRRKVAALYDEYFKNAKGIHIFPEREGERCVYWRYQIAVTDKYPLTKEKLVSKLMEHNVEARPIFTLMSENPCYIKASGKYTNASEISARSIDLPSSPNLTEDQVKRVAEIILHPNNL